VPCFAFFAQRDDRRASTLAAERLPEAGYVVARSRSGGLKAFLAFLVAPAGLLRPQCHLAFRFLRSALCGLAALVLFASQSGFAFSGLSFELRGLLAPLLFKP
jgi:hypothetical protein